MDPRLLEELQEIFNEIDPIGLIVAGAPPDEYELEIGAATKRLAEMIDIASTSMVLHEIFIRSFTARIAGVYDTYVELGTRVFTVLRREGLV